MTRSTSILRAVTERIVPEGDVVRRNALKADQP